MIYNVQPVSSGGLAASAALKSSKGRLHWLQAYNQNAAARYVMIFDATALPANGTAPLWMQPIAATSSLPKEAAFPPDGLPCVNGVYIALSSTPITLTIAAADMTFTAGVS